MINYLLLITVIVLVNAQNIFQKQFGNKKENNYTNYFLQYVFVMLLSAFIVLGVFYIFNFSFCLETLAYSSVFAVTFCISAFSGYKALTCGPMCLTSMLSSFSLIVPLIFGFLFLKESISTLGVVGLVLLIASWFLVNKTKKGEKINKKWLFYIIVNVISNGGNSTIQKLHQINVKGDYTICFQFIAMFISVIIFGSLLLFKKKTNFIAFFKNGGYLSSFSGIANAVLNVSMLYLAINMKAVILYPVVSAGGVVISFLTALIIYRERLKKLQYLGSILGLISIILLNL